MAKPVLLDLESQSTIKEAWLDHQGKTLAIVWKEGVCAAVRTEVVNAVGKAHHLPATEVTGGARDTAFRSFRLGGGWHRGAGVDRLSEEEAAIIAERIVLRVTAKAPTISTKTELLRPIIADIIRDCLVGSPDPSSAQCRKTFQGDLLSVVGDHLSRTETDALLEATGAGFRPVDGEH
jgi:hypothetical protein